MKKILCLLLALTMVFALCACGGKGESPTADYVFLKEELGVVYQPKTIDQIRQEFENKNGSVFGSL